MEGKNTQELESQLWYQTYRANALHNVGFFQLPIDQLLLVVKVCEPQYYSQIQHFLKQPFFIESKNGIRLFQELQQLDEIRIRYESDLKDYHKRIRTLIENIHINIKEHNG